MQIDKIRTFKD